MVDRDRDLTEDVRFILGEIHGVVKAMPSRMDRFETQVTGALGALNSRVSDLERSQAHTTGVRSTVGWFAGVVGGLVGSMLSGLLTYFAVKH